MGPYRVHIWVHIGSIIWFILKPETSLKTLHFLLPPPPSPSRLGHNWVIPTTHPMTLGQLDWVRPQQKLVGLWGSGCHTMDTLSMSEIPLWKCCLVTWRWGCPHLSEVRSSGQRSTWANRRRAPLRCWDHYHWHCLVVRSNPILSIPGDNSEC